MFSIIYTKSYRFVFFVLAFSVILAFGGCGSGSGGASSKSLQSSPPDSGKALSGRQPGQQSPSQTGSTDQNSDGAPPPNSNQRVGTAPPSEPLPVFPGAEGFGTTTPAGRGGQILKVTNLNDSGPGSLRAAVEASGARIIVFEVSGTIKLNTELVVTHPFMTLAGQTAPSPGITIRGGACFDIRTHDVLIQHIRLRPGDDPTTASLQYRDGFQITGNGGVAYNVVIDHVSASWSQDETGSTWASGDVTISNSIFAEGHYGVLIGNNSRNVTFRDNLMMSNHERQPRICPGVQADIVNNVAYNGPPWQMQIGESAQYPGFSSTPHPDQPTYISVVGNSFIAGPNTRLPHRPVQMLGKDQPLNEQSEVYVSDNLVDGNPLVPGDTFYWDTPDSPQVSTPPVALDGLTIMPSSQVEAYVVAHAGARPADRDAVDNRLINELENRTGAWTSTYQYPNLSENHRTFTIPANPNGDDNGDGYTNIEEVLFQMAAQVEGN